MENKKPTSVGIIISTYNNPEWLRKTLWGYACQTYPFSEIIIADDGSGKETEDLIKEYKTIFPCVKHVWHPDKGFQKPRILNKALFEAEAEYLIFTDQDCIPREDFVETHVKYAERGYFLSGGYFKLPMFISKQINEDDIKSNRAFDLQWLRSQEMKINFKCTKLVRAAFFSSLMNKITPARASWNGCNASGWREDFLEIKGFNEQMGYGGEDREFGERLNNKGVKSKQLRYSAICIHLDHARPYKNKEILDKNRNIRKEIKKNKVIINQYTDIF